MVLPQLLKSWKSISVLESKCRPRVVVILFRKKEVQIVGLRLKKKIQLGCFFTGQKYLANNQVFCGRFNLTTAIKLLLMRPTQVLCPPGSPTRDQPEWLLLSLCAGVLERSSAVLGPVVREARLSLRFLHCLQAYVCGKDSLGPIWWWWADLWNAIAAR